MTDTPRTQPARRWPWSRKAAQMDDVQRMLSRIDAALIVKDPGTARSVDAYDGLRKQVIAASGDRRRLLVSLSEFAEALRRGQSIEMLESKTEEWMMQSNLQRVTEVDPQVEAAFDITGPPIGDAIVAVPAYIDVTTGTVIRRGIAERVPVTHEETRDIEAADGHVEQPQDSDSPDEEIERTEEAS